MLGSVSTRDSLHRVSGDVPVKATSWQPWSYLPETLPLPAGGVV